MDSQKRDKTLNKEDSDSGLDNTSDISNSGDEGSTTINSDYEDILNSDNESTLSEKEAKSKVNDTLALDNEFASKAFDKTFRSSEEGIEIKIVDSDNPIELNDTIHLIESDFRDVIEFYKALVKSQCETVNFSLTSAVKKPEWLDEEKFKLGQKFARNHLFCINFAEMLSLFLLFAQKSSLGPLIFTGKSDSPFKAFTRYLNTLTKLMSWYQDDVWSETENLGKKNLGIVRGMHKNVYQKLSNSSEKDLAEKTTLGDPTTTALWCPMRDLLRDDFREFLPQPHDSLEQYTTCRKVWVNQADMSMTQFGFVGLAVTYPEYFGIHLATDAELDAFLHLWRGLGYLLGIKDEYNYCNTDLESVRRRTKFYIEAIAKPAFRDVSFDWEHMCRCLTSGISFYLPQVNFESSLLYLCHVLNINTPRLKKQISFRGYIIYQIHRLVFYLMKFPGVLNWLNSRLYEVIRKTQNASPEILNKWKNKEFSYMKQEGKCPINGHFTSHNL